MMSEEANDAAWKAAFLTLKERGRLHENRDPVQVTRVTGPRDRVEALSPGLPEIKEKSGIWNLVPVG